MLTVSTTQAICSSIGTGRESEDGYFFNFVDLYGELNFEGGAIFRKFRPTTLIVTPRDTHDTGIFIYATIEWGNPAITESIRSTLINSISFGETDVSALFFRLNDYLAHSFKMTSGRIVIGKVSNSRIEYISSGLDFYKWNKSTENTYERVYPTQGYALGGVDSDMIRFQMENSSLEATQSIEFEAGDALLFLPDYLEYGHRWSIFGQLDEELCGEPSIEYIAGIDLLHMLVTRNSSLLLDRLDLSHFCREYDLSSFRQSQLFEYLFALDLINQGCSERFLKSSNKWNQVTNDSFVCSKKELSCIRDLLPVHTIEKVVKVVPKYRDHHEDDTRYRIRCHDALFPPARHYEDLAVLRISLPEQP